MMQCMTLSVVVDCVLMVTGSVPGESNWSRKCTSSPNMHMCAPILHLCCDYNMFAVICSIVIVNVNVICGGGGESFLDSSDADKNSSNNSNV
jgi:hypothetical protein